MNQLTALFLVDFFFALNLLVKREDFGGKRRQKNLLDLGLESRVLSRCKPILQRAPINNFANIFGEKPVVDLGVACLGPIFFIFMQFSAKIMANNSLALHSGVDAPLPSGKSWVFH